jgi:ABC-type transporter Mla subunit MlaD
MAAERNAFKVGLVTVIVTLTFFVILLWISRGVGGATQQISVRFKSSPAMPTLAPGSTVLVGGQKVGRVLTVDLQPHAIKAKDTGETVESFGVLVKAEISRELVLRSDCQVFAEGPPLGGDGVVKIDLGKAKDKIQEGQVIEGADPGGFGAVLASLQGEFDGNNPDSLLGQIKSQLDPDGEASLMAKLLQSLNDINAVTSSLNRQMNAEERETLLAKIHQVMDNISTTTAVLRAEMDSQKPAVLLGKVHLAMDSMNDGLSTVAGVLKSNESRINHTFENIEKTTQNIAAETDPANADSLMAHFKKASIQLNSSLDDINIVTDTTRQVVVLNRENINKLLSNFKEASDHIKTGVKYVLRHPWRLLNEPKLAEIKQEAIFDAARSFADAASQIDDASAQLKALAELHDGNIPVTDPDLARIQAELKKTQERYQKAEQELWRQLNVE